MHSTKRENPILAPSPGVLKSLFLASRPKTWIAGLSPVLIGGALAAPLNWLHWIYCLFFSLCIQIGTNFANDYFDAIHGVDTANRIGPPRAVASGWLSPAAMRWAYPVLFGAALCLSWPLVSFCGLSTAGWVLSSILFGILYTGGPKPLGYLGLGELLVLFYFGPVAVGGTYYAQHLECPLPVLVCSLSPGLLATAILIANNLRDERGDRIAEKKTLVVRWGKRFGQIEYSSSLLGALFIPSFVGFWWHWFLLPFGGLLVKQACTYREEHEILTLLPKTALFLILFTLLFSMEAIFGVVSI